MYAIIETGGKQYRVEKGAQLKVERLATEVGDTVEFDKVLLVANDKAINVGAPILPTAKVLAKVLAKGRDRKVNIIKFKRRKHHMKRQGHRQLHTLLEIVDIKE
ncbi:MAG: 50S ribosomal protein L21 [Gammaproteobacteria bacterium]